jgi:ABC-type transport system involved in multi-copper enzyme maturation permease subunit
MSPLLSPLPSAPASPVAPNLGNAFGGIWRLTFRWFLAPSQWTIPAILLAVLALIAFATVREGNAVHYFRWVSQFYLTFLVPILAFLSGAGAMRDEMKPATADYILTRPVRRPAFVVFKFLSHLACIQVGFLLALGAVMAVGAYRHIPSLFAALPGLLLGQAVAVIAFAAFGLLCGTITSRYLVVGLFYGGIVESAIGRVPTQLNRLSMTHQLRALLEQVLPGFTPALPPEQSPLAIVGLLLAFSAIMITAAALCFAFQELAGARTNET